MDPSTNICSNELEMLMVFIRVVNCLHLPATIFTSNVISIFHWCFLMEVGDHGAVMVENEQLILHRKCNRRY